MSNPYAGQQYYEQAWQMGFDYTQANPTGDHSQAPDFSSWGLDDTNTGYVVQVWQEGALAGASAGTPAQPAHVEHQESAVHTAGEAMHYAYGAFGVARALWKAEPVGAIVEALLMVIIPNGPAIDPDADLKAWFSKTCQDGGWQEFFVTVAWTEGQVPSWYGNAHRDFDSAKNEIADIFNNTPGPLDPANWSLEVAHYRCDSPGEIEVIPVGVTQR